MSKMTMLEVTAICNNIEPLIVGYRVNNIFDINPKKYVIRLSKSNSKHLLVIESGNRIHLTKYSFQNKQFPNGFSMKLRKHLRGKTLSAFAQMGSDRAVHLTFGYDKGAHHLVLEIYSAGNIILMDNEFKIIALLRAYETDDYKVDIGEIYNTHRSHISDRKAITKEEILSKAKVFFKERLKSEQAPLTMNKSAKGKKFRRRGNPTLLSLINKILQSDPDMITHSLLSKQIAPKNELTAFFDFDSSKAETISAKNESDLQRLIDAANDCLAILKSFKETKPNAEILLGNDMEKYEKLLPISYDQFQHRKTISFADFNEAVDEFYKQREFTPSDRKEMERKAHEKRVQKVKDSNEARISALKEKQKAKEIKAVTLENNAELADKCIKAVNLKLRSKMDWKELEEFIKTQTKARNPIASRIHSLQLKKGEITLSLMNCSEETVFSGGNGSVCSCGGNCSEVKIPLQLSLTARQNARLYFGEKKNHKEKEEKTRMASKLALRTAEKKSRRIMEKNKIPTKPEIMRSKYWFEKFHWIISSESLLILSGRDKQQNAFLLGKVMNAEYDYFVGMENDHSVFALVQNHSPHISQKPPLDSLKEAGCIVSCKSSSWKDRTVISSFWTTADKVQKNKIEGEYSVQGEINYLPHQRLSFGVTFLFKNPLETVSLKDGKTHSENPLRNCFGCGCLVEFKEHQCLVNVEKGDLERENFNENVLKAIQINPRPNSEFALAVCGSIDFCRRSKCFYEIVPGSEKRGKAAKAIYSWTVDDKVGKRKGKKKIDFSRFSEEAIECVERSLVPTDLVMAILTNGVKVVRGVCSNK